MGLSGPPVLEIPPPQLESSSSRTQQEITSVPLLENFYDPGSPSGRPLQSLLAPPLLEPLEILPPAPILDV